MDDRLKDILEKVEWSAGHLNSANRTIARRKARLEIKELIEESEQQLLNTVLKTLPKKLNIRDESYRLGNTEETNALVYNYNQAIDQTEQNLRALFRGKE